MKTVSILAILNALTLAALVLLFVQVDDLKGQLRSPRSTASRSAPTVDEAAIERRILDRITDRGRPAPAPLPTEVSESAAIAAVEETRSAAPPPEAGDAEIDASGYAILDGREMEEFRLNVRKANALNQEEERVRQIVGELDRLIGENRIGLLDTARKQRVARTLVGARDRMPEVWARLRDNPQLRNLPREERMTIIRTEFEALRGEVQTSLEEIVPAADAKTILDETLRGGGPGAMFDGGGPGGGRRRG